MVSVASSGLLFEGLNATTISHWSMTVESRQVSFTILKCAGSVPMTRDAVPSDTGGPWLINRNFFSHSPPMLTFSNVSSLGTSIKGRTAALRAIVLGDYQLVGLSRWRRQITIGVIVSYRDLTCFGQVSLATGVVEGCKVLILIRFE